jgi:hypothetical protein
MRAERKSNISFRPKMESQKGLRSILLERQLWTAVLNVKEAGAVLAEQVDFASQKGWLEETIVSGGIDMKMIFYPKFHCEFNFIELYWRYCKRCLRSNCDYSWNRLNELLPKALDSARYQRFENSLENACDIWTHIARRTDNI